MNRWLIRRVFVQHEVLVSGRVFTFATAALAGFPPTAVHVLSVVEVSVCERTDRGKSLNFIQSELLCGFHTC